MNILKNCFSKLTVLGWVSRVSETSFELKLFTRDSLTVVVTKTTNYEVIRNVGGEGLDRVEDPQESEFQQKIGKRDDAQDKELWDAKWKIIKYIKEGLMICVQGIRYDGAEGVNFSARRVVLMHSEPGQYQWEESSWWLQQVNTLVEQWLDVLFQGRREINENDFAEMYHTNLDLLGGTTDNQIQECATMSRFLYGLSSSYMLTGNERALSAAHACARYLMHAYSITNSDGVYVLWKFGRVKEGHSTKEYIGSLNPDDYGTFPLYEQIYALSGLTQYYRITQDTKVLDFITRTIKSFQRYYLDEKDGGYFSHIDTVTRRPDSPALDATNNRSKKNWNSIGDHIPAYLINLLISIDPLPLSNHNKEWEELRDLCRKILDDCVEKILTYFDPERDESMFVNERFDKNWKPDHTWGWQRNRGIVGHNLKISWNLTRCAHYYDCRAKDPNADQEKYKMLMAKCHDFAHKLGRNMKEVGVDLIRGGIFDALERKPESGMKTDFAWSCTKDFWQQEQAILAYYIMHRHVKEPAEKKEFLNLARFCSAFWNLFFIDHDNRKVFFRTTEGGEPVIEGQYGIQAGHAIAGYHAFELNYLAHLYIRTFVDRKSGNDNFVVFFRPLNNNLIQTLNVLPDFFQLGDLKIIHINVNGLGRDITGDEQYNFQIDISSLPDDSVIMVEFLPIGRESAQNEEMVNRKISTTSSLQFGFAPRKLR